MTQFIGDYNDKLGVKHDYDAARFKSIHAMAEMLESQFKRMEARTAQLNVRIDELQRQLTGGMQGAVVPHSVETSGRVLSELHDVDEDVEAAMTPEEIDAIGNDGDGVQDPKSSKPKEYAPGPDGQHYEV